MLKHGIANKCGLSYYAISPLQNLGCVLLNFFKRAENNGKQI